MANLNIEMPDDLARSLEGIAAARHKSVQELALEQLNSLAATVPEPPARSLTLLIRTDPNLGDGRHANNPWLQELPRPLGVRHSTRTRKKKADTKVPPEAMAIHQT